MTMLRVERDIFATFPDVILGVVTVHGIDNTGEQEAIMASLRQEQARVVERFANAQINDLPQIKPWREAYRSFGAKPKDYPSSIENLVRRVVKGHNLPHINTLVDIYNGISLRYLVPVGGEDLSQIQGDVHLAFASEHEAALRLLGESEERSPKPGEVVYRDDVSAICRRWNWKEAERTKLTEHTKDAFLVIEGLPPVDRALVEQATSELAALVQQYCGGNISTQIIDATHPETQL